jgi:hypothetical protein
VREIGDLGFSPEALTLMMRDNALRIFKRIPR